MKTYIVLLLTFMVTHGYSTQLEYIDRIADNTGAIDGLAGAKKVLVTADDRFTYVAGENDHSICWLERTITNELEYSGRVQNDSNGTSGLEFVYDICFSQDEGFIYAVTYYSNTLVWFSRNKDTGLLTYEGKLVQDTNGVDGLYIPTKVVLSPSGNHLYTVSYNDNSIGLFSLDSITGLPTYQNIYKNGLSTISGLEGATDFCVTPDGNNAYAVAYKDSSIVVFNNNFLTGELSFNKKYSWAELQCAALIRPRQIISSNDGNYIYIGSSRGRIAWLSRNATTGSLTFLDEIIDDQNGVEGLADLSDMRLFDNDHKLIVTGWEGVSLFTIDSDNGSLSFLEFCRDDQPINVGFIGTSVAFTSDYQNIYVSDFNGGLHILKYSSNLSIYQSNTESRLEYTHTPLAYYNLLGSKSMTATGYNRKSNIIITIENGNISKYFSGVLPLK